MTPTNQQTNPTLPKLQQTFPEAIREIIAFLGEVTVVVDHEAIVDVCTFLRDDPDLAFNYMCDLCAVDMWPEHPRFEVNIQLLAMMPRPQPGQGARRLRVKARLDEHDAKMPTLTEVWPSANWYERETHDLFGIDFEGHPDLRPLLLPDDWDEPPPLRRDIPVHVEEVAFSFSQARIYRDKPFARE
jgi:NADH-quinone oxidoreductase subunit C